MSKIRQIYGWVYINCTGNVDISSGSSMAVNGNLYIYNSNKVNLYADGNSVTNGVADITSNGDVTLESTSGRAAKTLTIKKASDVTIKVNSTSGLSEDTQITASGTVLLENAGGPLGKFAFKQADDKDYVYCTKAEDGFIDAAVTPIPANLETNYLRIEEKQDAEITVKSGTATAGGKTDASLKSFKGQKVTVTATGETTETRHFDHWELTTAPAGFTIDAEDLKKESFDFMMPAGEVELTAVYSNKLVVNDGTVTGGTVDEDGFVCEGANVTVEAKDRGKDYQFDHWELNVAPSLIGKTEDDLKNSELSFDMPDAAVELTAVYRAAVKVRNAVAEAGGKSSEGSAYDEDNIYEVVYVLEGEDVTVTAHDKNASFSKFVGWKLEEGDIAAINDSFTLDDDHYIMADGAKLKETTLEFKMSGKPVALKAIYSIPAAVMDLPVIVKGGTINDTDETIVRAKPGTPITVKADETPEDSVFLYWKVEQGTSEDFGVTKGSLGSETELGTEEISFNMPQGAVLLTAVVAQKNTVTVEKGEVEGGTAKSILGEGDAIEAVVGAEVEITATELDPDIYPGMMFDHWEIVYPNGTSEDAKFELDDPNSKETSFVMPAYAVTLIPHWTAGSIAPIVDPDEPLDPGFAVEPDYTGAIVASAALGGAAILGGYEITTRVILNDLLPAGAAIPANRGELAMLIWTEKGKPEPSAQPAFTDVNDAELAKAAEWCVEQGYLTAKDGKFKPNGWMPKFKTIEVWKKAF